MALRNLTLGLILSRRNLPRVAAIATRVSSISGSSSSRRLGKLVMALGAGMSAAAATARADAVPTEEAVQTPQASWNSCWNLTLMLNSLLVQGNGGDQPELMTEYMVDMKCESCANSVRNKLEPLEGVKSVTIDLANQVVRVLGTASVKNMNAALEQSGRNARVIGQGSPEEFGTAAAVAEFKGPQIHGVVRFAQVNMILARVEAVFTGLTPGRHGWSINTYGDLTRGASSTGGIFNPQNHTTEALGDLGVLEAGENGRAEFTGTKKDLRVGDLVGRALVVYETEDKAVDGIAAAVIARSAGVGENYKRLCTCDGTVIWES